MTARSQRILLWWGLTFMVVYGLVWWGLFHMMPPPSAKWSADEIARFYVHNGSEIKIGATIASWTSGFMVPIAVVVAIQIARHEDGKPVSFIAHREVPCCSVVNARRYPRLYRNCGG